MELQQRSRRHAGYTRTDFTAMSLVAVLLCGVLLLPALGRSKSYRDSCISNLKQIALGFRMWANDHGDRFPMAVPVKEGGTLEFAESSEVFRHFVALSNELTSPKPFRCPKDVDAQGTDVFTTLSNGNVSYFLGIDAREEMRSMVLAGDRNITGGTWVKPHLLVFTNATTASFTSHIHNRAGNIALADGSAQQVTDSSLRKSLEAGGLPVRLAVPFRDFTPIAMQRAQSIPWWVIILIAATIIWIFYAVIGRRLWSQPPEGVEIY